jgi:hypothetical protein
MASEWVNDEDGHKLYLRKWISIEKLTELLAEASSRDVVYVGAQTAANTGNITLLNADGDQVGWIDVGTEEIEWFDTTEESS